MNCSLIFKKVFGNLKGNPKIKELIGSNLLRLHLRPEAKGFERLLCTSALILAERYDRLLMMLHMTRSLSLILLAESFRF